MTCANTECQHDFDRAKSVALDNEPPQTGDLFLCPDCGLVNVAHVANPNSHESDLTLRLLLDTEFNLLDSDTRRDLDFASRNIQAKWKQLNKKLHLHRPTL